MDAVNKFFYNLIPGLYFLFFLFITGFFGKLSFVIRNYDWQIIIFLIIFLGLLIGFIFQGLTKLLRKNYKKFGKCSLWNVYYNPFPPFNPDLFSFDKVKTGDSKSYDIAKSKILKLYGENKSDDEEETKLDNIKRNFYLMHHYILVKEHETYANHFHHILALWSNLYWASFLIFFILLVICLINQFYFFYLIKNHLLAFVVNIFFVFLSRWEFLEYIRIFYDTILKTFVIVIKDEKVR